MHSSWLEEFMRISNSPDRTMYRQFTGIARLRGKTTPLAQYNLGHQYLKGLGVVRDEVRAMQWWRVAAEQGKHVRSV